MYRLLKAAPVADAATYRLPRLPLVTCTSRRYDRAGQVPTQQRGPKKSPAAPSASGAKTKM